MGVLERIKPAEVSTREWPNGFSGSFLEYGRFSKIQMESKGAGSNCFRS